MDNEGKQPEEAPQIQGAQPGQVINPGGSTSPGPNQSTVPSPPLPPEQQYVNDPPAAQVQPAVTASSHSPQPQQPQPNNDAQESSSQAAANQIPEQNEDFNNQSSFYNPESDSPQQDFSNQEDIAWIAPEFVEHEKSSKWYLGLTAAAVLLGCFFYFISKDLITAIVIMVAILVVGFYGLRRPKTIEYRLGGEDLNVGAKRFTYADFRSFTVIPEGKYTSVTFMPLKRFAPPIGLCFSSTDENRVLDYLSQRLPYEKHDPDILERFMMRIRY